MASVKIIWSPSSIQNLEEIAGFISINSPFYAPIFVQKIIDSVERLKDFPLSGRVVPEFEKPELREVIFHNYRIVYRTSDEFVEIVSVSHASKLLN